MCTAKRNVRFTPESDIKCVKVEFPLWANSRHWSHSLYNLVGAGEQRWRQRKAECLCRLEVDHQLELGWRLHREVGRLFALEDAVDVGGGTPVGVGSVRAVRDQSAIGNENAKRIDGRQPVASRKRDD